MTTANINPVFVGSPDTYMGVTSTYGHLSAANTARDGSGTTVPIVDNSLGTTPVRIDVVTATAIGTTTAGMIRLFLSNGSAARLIKEITVDAITPSGTVAAWTDEWSRQDDLAVVVVPAGGSLLAATHNAEDFHVTAQGGAY